MRNWTDEQRKAIDARGTHLLVSAGAGSGKTAVMIERICALLREGADLRQTVVCTFTKTAAADMKRKLGEALADANDAWLHKQLRYLPQAEISTLHAWCAHLIKSWFFAAQPPVDPESTVLEEGEEVSLKNAAAEQAVAERREQGDEAFAGLYAALYKNRSHRRLKEAVLAVYDYARAQADFYGWLRLSAQRTDAQYRAALLAQTDTDAQRIGEELKELLPHLRASGAAADTVAAEQLYACVCAGEPYACALSPMRSDAPSFIWHERLKTRKAAYAEVCKKREKIRAMPSHEDSLPYARALTATVERMHELYTESKRARGKMDYADLEHTALQILRGEHGRDIVAKYKYVFVDEYQDISPLQEEILRCFACEMFFVGDVKQSIYGFRMCRPKFFREKQKAYRAGAGTALELTANFRSGGGILQTVNDVFGKVMTEQFGGADYKSAPFRAGKTLSGQVRARLIRTEEECPDLPAGVYSAEADTAEIPDPALEKEADATVEEILDMLGGEVPDEEAGEGKTRPVDYGDVAVLVRSRGAFCDLLEKKLRALSLPVAMVSSDTSADVFPSVSALLSLFRVLDNARDDVHLGAVLLSPLFGDFTPDELAHIRLSGGGLFCDAFYALAESGEDNDVARKAAAFASELRQWRLRAAEKTVAELAGDITARYGCFSKALLRGGEREAAALDAFMEHLAGAENDTLHDYLRYIAVCGVPRLSVQEGGRAIRIMTVHASKGLEFACVVLPELHKQFNMRDASATVLCDEQEGAVLRTFDFENRIVRENPRFAVCAQKSKRAVAEEEMRVLYVAMTRAKYRLSLLAQAPAGERDAKSADAAGAYLDWLYDFLTPIAAQTPPAACEDVYMPAPPKVLDSALAQTLGARFAQEERAAALRAAITENAVKVSVSAVAHAQEENAPAPLYQDDRAAITGTAYHKFMQWADFASPDAWEKLCARFPQEGALTDRAELTAAFAAMHAYIGGRAFLREKAFVYSAPASMAGGTGNGHVLVQGVIDLLVFNRDGSVEIVDYKTGKEENLHSAAYAKQLALYARAVENVLKRKVCAAYLYGFSCRKFLRIEV